MCNGYYETMDSAILREEALKLSSYERAQLADQLILSLSEDITESILNAWSTESEDRLAAYRDGKIDAQNGNKVISDLRTEFSS